MARPHRAPSPTTLFGYRRVKARLHDLRHLQASLLLDAGEAITTVAARLGHRDTATTLKVYCHLMPGADARAAGIVGVALTRPAMKGMTVGWSPGGPLCTVTGPVAPEADPYARPCVIETPPATTAPTAPVRVLIADDQSVFLQGLGVVLSIGGRIQVVAVAENGEDAIARAVELVPDVALLDVRMPGMSGIEAARVISRQVPITKIIMLTASDEEDDLFEAIKAGATGYLRKDTSIEEVAAVIWGVARGQSLITPSMASKLLLELQRSDPAEAASPSYTSRELEVLKLLAKGMSSSQVGTELSVSEATAENHVRNILEKLHRGRSSPR